MKKVKTFLLKNYLVLILPIVFLVIALIVHYSRGKFYLAYVDPEYFHLFNGLNLAIFNLAVDFIHHPGTTIQVIIAISAHFVNLMQPGFDLISNAMNNPEQFIHGANILLNLITTTSLLLLGIYTFKITGNIFYALLLQLMPYGNFMILIISGRLIPEAALTAPLIFLVLLMVRFIYDKEPQKNMKRYVIGFAIIGGLGMAGKFLYLPFLIIPLFILPTLKWRLRYVIYTAAAVIVFAFPVFVHIGKSVDWFGNMFLHSGKWGSGSDNFIDTSSALENLNALFLMDKSFFVLFGLATILLISMPILSYFNKTQPPKLLLKALMGLVISIVISVFLVSKHFAPHYIYPTFVFKAFLIFLMTVIIVKTFPSKRMAAILPAMGLAVGLILAALQVEPLFNTIAHLKQEAELFDNRQQVLMPYNTAENPLIITSHYRGSPFIESAMVAGYLMSGPLKTTFTEELTEKYPRTYFYYDWTDDFFLWDQFKKASEIVEEDKPLYIFIGEGREEKLDIILDRLKVGFPNKQLKLNLLHHFKSPDEYFYEVVFVKKPLS